MLPQQYPSEKTVDLTRMDVPDHSIVALLRKDGHQSFAEIAKLRGVRQGRVRHRVSKPIEDQVVRISNLVNPHDLGYGAPAKTGFSVRSPYRNDMRHEFQLFLKLPLW